MKSVIICNMEGVIQEINKGALDMFGYSKDELIGIKRVSIFSEADIVIQNVLGWLEEANKKGKSVVKTRFKIKDGSFFNAEILFDVPPEAFDIKPKVDSSFIRLIPKKNLNYDLSIKNNLFKVIDLAFSSRRKNVKNNLKSLDIDWENLELDPNSRSEDLSTHDFINLSRNHKI